MEPPNAALRESSPLARLKESPRSASRQKDHHDNGCCQFQEESLTMPQHRPHGIIQPLLTDLYQITMAYAYWKAGKKDEIAVFDLFFRKNPFQGEFVIFAGLEECIKFVENFCFSDDDLRYLKEVLPAATTDPAFFDYLKTIEGSQVKMYAVREGTIVFPREPLIRVEGPIPVAQLLETTLLTLINYPSLVATNAARFRLAAGRDKQLVEFGLRRAQGPDGGLSASKYTYVGGFDGTSNVLAGKLFGIPVYGTHAHAYVSSFAGLKCVKTKMLRNKISGKDENFLEACAGLLPRVMEALHRQDSQTNEGELAAFISYAVAFPDSYLALVDTYNSEFSGIPNACAVALALDQFGYKPAGIRLDSGDLAYMSKRARAIFRTLADYFQIPSIAALKIVASNDINEETIYALREQQHEIDSFGCGTHLVTCQRQPALGCVYKLVLLQELPKIKLSEEVTKVTIPGKKYLYRLYGQDGKARIDLIRAETEQVPESGARLLCRHPFIENKRCYVTPAKVESLLIEVWANGERSAAPQTLSAIRERVQSSLAAMREDHIRRLNPTPYKVSLSPEMYDFFHKLWLEETPVGDIS